jgi:hypothetical protein
MPARFRFSSDTNVRRPKTEDAYPVTISEWNHLKDRIRSIEQSDPSLQTAIGALIGITVTAIFALISLPENNSTWNPTWYGIPLSLLYLAVAFVFGVSTIPFIYFHRKQRRFSSIMKEDIIKEMERTEEKFTLEAFK